MQQAQKRRGFLLTAKQNKWRSKLKQTHVTFNELQYRLWAEVLVSGVYTDTQNPPPYTQCLEKLAKQNLLSIKVQMRALDPPQI